MLGGSSRTKNGRRKEREPTLWETRNKKTAEEKIVVQICKEGQVNFYGAKDKEWKINQGRRTEYAWKTNTQQ